MPESTLPQLLSSETISSIAELWKLAACFLVAFLGYIFRTPITQILLNLRKIRSRNTVIDIASPLQQELIQEPSLALSQKAPPQVPSTETPESSPDGDSLFSEMFSAIYRRENEQARELRDQWIEKNPSERTQNEVLYLHLLCKFQRNSDAVQELEQLRHNEAYSEQLPYIYMTLGEFYESIDQYENASQYFKDWEETATTQLAKANAVVARSRIIALSETPKASLHFLQRHISRYPENECLAQIFHQIAEIYRQLGNEFMRCVALEKVVQYRPTDSAIRFEAAYAQSSSKLPHLSLKNYEIELTMSPMNALARNNYAVQLANFGILSKSVEQYEKAREDGNSLAVANLAYLYIEKGLLGDADRLLREAQAKPDYHENIDRALTDLHKMVDTEVEKLATIRNRMSTFQKFVRQYADAHLNPSQEVHRFAGTWNNERTGDMIVEQDDDSFHAEWGLSSSKHKIQGIQHNNSGELRLYTATPNPFLANEEPQFGMPRDALAYVSDDGTRLEIFSYEEEPPQILSFLRVAKG